MMKKIPFSGRVMRRSVVLVALFFAFGLAFGPASNPAPVEAAPIGTYCLAGDFNTWNENAKALNDAGSDGDAVSGDGIYTTQLTLASAGTHQMKVVTCEDWGNAWPAGNFRAVTTSANQTVTITFDTNVYNDGWLPATNIVNSPDDEDPTSFTGVGDWQGWSNANPATALTDAGGGIYELTYNVPLADSYVGKIVLTGTWNAYDASGGPLQDGTGENLASFTTYSDNEDIEVKLNTNTGRIYMKSTQAPPPVYHSLYHSACSDTTSSNCSGDHAAVEAVPLAATTDNFSSVQVGGPFSNSDVYAYDDEPVTLWLMGDAGELTDDATYPYIRWWNEGEVQEPMSYVGTENGLNWKGRLGNYDFFSGQMPKRPAGEMYYWLTVEAGGNAYSLCRNGSENDLGQAVGGDCSFNDYAYYVVDDDTSGPAISNLTFADNGALGGGDDEVCADVNETGTDSGDNDSAVASVEVIYSDELADLIIGQGSSATMTNTTGDTYCNSSLSFSDPTYYRVMAANDDQDHPDGENYSDVDVTYSPPDTCAGASCTFPSGDGVISWAEVLHNTRRLDYRDPFGAVPTGTAVTLNLRTALDDVPFVFVQVYGTPTGTQTFALSKTGSDATYDYYEVTLPASVMADPALVTYKFLLVDGADEDWYVDDYAHGEYDHEDRYENGTGMMVDANDGAVVDNAFQIMVYDQAAFTTYLDDWSQHAVIYQMMPDRFRNGDESNDGWLYNDVYGTAVYQHPTWHEAPVNPRDAGSPFYEAWSADFFGGDLQGVIDELDYLQAQGVTAIYFNPIFNSPSNHGYDTTDYSIINPRYGDNALFQTLAAEAEARGIKIILDGVFNHTGSDSRYFDRYHRWDAAGNPVTGDDGSGACEAETSSFADFYNFNPTGSGPCYNGNDYESWFGFDSLPIVTDTLPPAPDADTVWEDYVFDIDDDGNNGMDGGQGIVQYWNSLGADGWRFDVGNEIPHEFWQAFRDQVKVTDGWHGPLYNEVWYEADPWLYGDELDATMNYRYRKAVLGFLIDSTWTDNDNNGDATMHKLSASEFDYVLGSIREDYPPETWYAMMNLMGSHDTNRALFVLDEQSAALSDAIKKMRMMAALQFTYPGAPTVYYGDEVGLGAADYGGYGNWGAGYDDGSTFQDDPYNRHPMIWEEDNYTFDSSDGSTPIELPNADLQAYYATLAQIRNSYPVLRTGEVATVHINDANDTYGYARYDGSSCAIALFNRATVTQSITTNVDLPLPAVCSGTFTDALTGNTFSTSGSQITVTGIPALTSVILVQPIDNPNTLASVATLPPAEILVDQSLATGANATLNPTVLDITNTALPAGEMVNFRILSGPGTLSSPTALTDGSGTASVTYQSGTSPSSALVESYLVGHNGLPVSGYTFIHEGYTVNNAAVDKLTVGPEVLDDLAGTGVKAHKFGNGETVIGLASLGDAPTGLPEARSDYFNVQLSSAAGIDALDLTFAYGDQTNEANNQLWWWNGDLWLPVGGTLDTTANTVTFNTSGSSLPALSQLVDGGLFVISSQTVSFNAPTVLDVTTTCEQVSLTYLAQGSVPAGLPYPVMVYRAADDMLVASTTVPSSEVTERYVVDVPFGRVYPAGTGFYVVIGADPADVVTPAMMCE